MYPIANPSGVAQFLREAKDIIAYEVNWCVGSMARDSNNEHAQWDMKDAVKFCAIGACHRAYYNRNTDNDEQNQIWHDAREFLFYTASKLYDMSSAQVNDTLGHAATLKMYDKAIEMADEKAIERANALAAAAKDPA